MRYAWDMQARYLRENGVDRGPLSWLIRHALHKIRIWDVVAAQKIDAIAVNSQFVSKRVAKYYGRKARVIHPPVELENFDLQSGKDDHYVTASRLVPYKKINMIVEAFNRMPSRKLIVIGEGPQLAQLRKLANPNVTIAGHLPAEEMATVVGRAKAFVFAAIEDFGIAPLEAQAAGTPVIALGMGGLLETVRGLGQNEPTGVFFYEQTPEALMDAVDEFEANAKLFIPHKCRQNALRFNQNAFRTEFREFVNEALAAAGMVEQPLAIVHPDIFPSSEAGAMAATG